MRPRRCAPCQLERCVAAPQSLHNNVSGQRRAPSWCLLPFAAIVFASPGLLLGCVLFLGESPHRLGRVYLVQPSEIAPLIGCVLALRGAKRSCRLLLGPMRRALEEPFLRSHTGSSRTAFASPQRAASRPATASKRP